MKNRIVRKIMTVLLSAVFLLSLVLPASAADGNMDGDGGGMGEGTGDNVWNPGNDGVRITVINKETQAVVGNSFDRTNITPPAKTYSFVKRNKLFYMGGGSIVPSTKEYQYLNPVVSLPQVISSNGTSNIAAVKAYFTDEGRIRAIAEDAGISYETLISGDYTILIEPIAFFKYNGVNYAMTATEAALYDRMVDGALRSSMGLLTHQNLPLSMFLEHGELGVEAWSGGGGIISDENILQYLGIGTVNFTDSGDDDDSGSGSDDGTGDGGSGTPGSGTGVDYEYREDTDVITSIMVSSTDEINPDSPGRATFTLPDGSRITREFVIPEDESQLVWIKWKTPKVSADTYYNIPVSLSDGSTSKSSLRIKVVPVVENTPPDPQARDRNDTFRLVSAPTETRVNSLSWGEWAANWHEHLVKVPIGHSRSCPPDCDEEHFEIVDEGWWNFTWQSYSAQLSVTTNTLPDERVPTATKRYGVYTMKSGYGINAEVKVSMSTNGGSGNTTEVQYISAVFPEFKFQTYNRLLVPDGGRTGYIKTWGFSENEYSQFRNPVHFTPLWYPDNTKFPVSFTVLDAWTPAGMLSYVITANDILIDGNVYQDWHIAPGFGSD